jgi:hypothetical protein
MRSFIYSIIGFLTGAHLRLNMSFGGGSAPAPAPPQAAPPAPAPLKPPTETEMGAKVVNPEARRRQLPPGRTGRVFGSRFFRNVLAGGEQNMGAGSTKLGGGR